MSTPLLEIHIHLTNGTVSRFMQDDPDLIEKTLSSINPDRVFSQRDVVIAGRYTMTAFACAAIARLDFIMEGYPGWPFHFNIQDAVQITREEFEERFIPGSEEIARAEVQVVEGEPVVAYAEMELLNSEKIYSEVRFLAQVRTPLERGMAIQHLFGAPSLYARRRGGGAVVINPANLVRMTFFPGPPETPPGAWPARHVTAI